VRRLFMGVLELLRPVPPIALIPVAILWFGIDDASKVSIITYAAMWPILLNVILGVQSVPPIIQATAKSLGITGGRYFVKIVLPHSVPQIMVGLRVAGAIAFVVVVASEMVAATAGVGYWILDSERTFRTPQMFAGIAVLSILGALVNLALLKIERLTTKWQ
jgi:ABC-type nitrate/sulfonate/bicarbonate transport system permease component